MAIKKITKAQQGYRKWSGGEVFDIYSYPEGSTFDDENMFNIACATCTDNESTFSHLPGLKRYIMILGGEIEIIHPGRYSKKLEPLKDVDCYLGDWGTKSIGKYNDFNFVCKGKYDGNLVPVQIKEDIAVDGKSSAFHGFYAVDGHVTVETDDESVTLAAGDFAIIEGICNFKITTNGTKCVNVVLIPVSE